MAMPIVDDAEYEALHSPLTSLSTALANSLYRYNSLLQTLQDEGMVSGQAAENFKMFALQSKLLEGKAELLIDEIKAELTSYLEDVDVADRYLYGAKALGER
jgi:hypothetical protein